MIDLAQIRSAILRELGDDEKIIICILFGSAVGGKMNPASDIDIAVGGHKALEIDHLVDIQLKISRATGRETDVLDLNRIEGLILKKVLRSGTVLIKKDVNFYGQLIKKSLFFDADILPQIRRIQKTRAERFING